MVYLCNCWNSFNCKIFFRIHVKYFVVVFVLFSLSLSGKNLLNSMHDDQKHTTTILALLILQFSIHALTHHAKKFKVLNEIPEVKPYQNLLKVKTCGIFSISCETFVQSEHWKRAWTFLVFFGFETNVSIRNVGNGGTHTAGESKGTVSKINVALFLWTFFYFFFSFSFIRKVSYASCVIELTYWMNSTVDWEKYTLVASTSCSKSSFLSRESIQHQIKLFTSFNLVNYDQHSFFSSLFKLISSSAATSFNSLFKLQLQTQLNFMLFPYLCEIECFC